jgi:hypothetical protein
VDRSGLVLQVSTQPEGEKNRRVEQTHRVRSFSFDDSDHKADVMELDVDNFDLQNFDDPTWRKGGLVTVTWGYSGATQTRTGVITSVKGSISLAVKAHAKSVLMNTERKSTAWVAARRSLIAQEMAKRYGYTDASTVHIEDTQIIYDTIHQAGMTDAQFLARLAKQEGFQFYVDATGFHFHRRNLGQKPLRVLHYYGDPGQGDVIDFDLDNDITGHAGSVNVSGRDPLTRRDYTAKANNDETKRQGLAPNPEVQGDQYSLDRRTREISVKRLVVAEQLCSPAPTEAAAKRVADGKFRQTQLGVVKLKATIIGDPLLAAKCIVEWRGLGARVSGNYYVSRCKHVVGKDAYRCEIECRRDGHSEQGTPASKAQVNTQKAPDPNGAQGRYSLQRRTREVEYTPATGGPNDIPWSPPP